MGQGVEIDHLGMLDRDFIGDLVSQGDASSRQNAGVFRDDLQADLRHVDDREIHPTEAEIIAHRAMLAGMNDRVLTVDKGRRHGDPQAFDAPPRAIRDHGDQPEGAVEDHSGFGLNHLDRPGFDQRRRGAHHIGPGHRIGLVGEKQNESRIRLGPGRRGQQHHRRGRPAARLQHQGAPQGIIHRVDMRQLVGHRLAGNIQHPRGDHPPDLTLAMHIDKLKRS